MSLSFKKIFVVLSSLSLLLLLITPSTAQSPTPTTSVEVKAKVSPNKSGTKKKPRSVNLDIKGKISTTGEEGLNKPVVRKIEVLFPKGSYYAGGKLPKGIKGKVAPKCSESRMLNGLPKDTCPKGSIMGKGSGNAWADTVKTKAKFTLVNGGKDKVFVFTEMTNPAVVQLPVPGKITKMKGKWAYKLTLTVPEDLQVVAGVPISLIDFNMKTKSKNWLFTTSCPKNKKWPFEVTTYQDSTAPATYKSFARCK